MTKSEKVRALLETSRLWEVLKKKYIEQISNKDGLDDETAIAIERICKLVLEKGRDFIEKTLIEMLSDKEIDELTEICRFPVYQKLLKITPEINKKIIILFNTDEQLKKEIEAL